MRNLNANKINIIPKEIVRNSTWHKIDKTDRGESILTITTSTNLILCQPKSSNNVDKIWKIKKLKKMKNQNLSCFLLYFPQTEIIMS